MANKPKQPTGRAISCRPAVAEKIERLRRADAPMATTALFLAVMARVYETASTKQKAEAMSFVVNE